MNVNVILAVDGHVVDAIEEARQEADDALERYVDARKKIAELEAMRDLRMAMGGTVANTIKIEPLREASGA